MRKDIMIKNRLPIGAELFINDKYISFSYKFKNITFTYYYANDKFTIFRIIDDSKNISIIMKRIDNIFSFMKILKLCIINDVDNEFRYKYCGNECICVIKIVDNKKNRIEFNCNDDNIYIINYLYINKNDKNQFIKIIDSIVSILNVSALYVDGY